MYGLSISLGFVISQLTGLGAQPAFLTLHHARAFAALAIGFSVGGYALRVWASSYLAASIVWQQDVALGELRVSGPYRFTRNPLYLGNLLQAIGVGLLVPWPATILLVAAMVVYELALVSVEESFLAKRHGESYARYRASVARFVPLPWKIAPDGGQPGSLLAGLRSELMCAGFALVALVDVAFTLVASHHAR